MKAFGKDCPDILEGPRRVVRQVRPFQPTSRFADESRKQERITNFTNKKPSTFRVISRDSRSKNRSRFSRIPCDSPRFHGKTHSLSFTIFHLSVEVTFLFRSECQISRAGPDPTVTPGPGPNWQTALPVRVPSLDGSFCELSASHVCSAHPAWVHK